MTCRSCGTRQPLGESEGAVLAVDLQAVRALLRGRPSALLCRACRAVLPAELEIEVQGDGWTAVVGVEGPARRVAPDALVGHLSKHLQGVIGALWRAADRHEQHQLARDRSTELTAEAMAATLLGAEGLLGEWVVGDGNASLATVDDMLGPPQATALVAAALSAVPDGGPALAPIIDRHVAPGLVLPIAARRLTEATTRMIDDVRLEGRALPTALTVHAAAQQAAGRPDPLARAFTRQWITLAWAADEQPDDPQLRRLRPPPDLLARAVDIGAFTDAVMQTTDAPAGWIERLQRIAEQAGHPNVVRQAVRRLPTVGRASSSVFQEALTRAANAADGRKRLVEALDAVLDALRVAGRTGEMEAMTDHALRVSDGSDAIRATLLTRFGSAAKDARMPEAFLKKVGHRAGDWEAALPPRVRLALDTERSTALRMAGRPDEAQEVLGAFLDLTLDDDTRWRAEFNLALITRDAGAIDAALRTTEDLLRRAPDNETRFLAYQSLARTTTALGRHGDAVAHYRAALGLADGASDHLVPALRASMATLLAAAGDAAAALAELTVLTAGPLDAQATLGVADTVTVLLERGEHLDASLVERTLTDLEAVLERSRAAGDRTIEGSALRVRARLHEMLGDGERAAADWEALLGVFADPFALVSLARLRWMAERRDEARALLVAVPEALLHEHGGATDIGVIVDMTGRLRGALRRLATAMMPTRPTPDDVRLAAELSRDAIGRTRAWAAAEHPPPSRAAIAGGLRRGVLQPLIPAAGALWVIEWWASDDAVQAVQTRITADGGVAARPLPEMPGDPVEAAEHILSRLQGWLTTQPGDPLDRNDWQKLASWLYAAMDEAAEGDHLVIIEHPGLNGLPWHAVGGATWTTSYAPGWTALLDLDGGPHVVTAMGLASVPARGDSDVTAAAFARGIDRARRDAERHGVHLDLLEGADTTSAAVLDLLRRTDLVVLQCHGLIDPDRLEMALLVAHDGQLPTQHPIAASSEHGAAYRLTWRNLQDVVNGPRVVLSAACSTGQALIGGLGERLGLFAALRSRGTRAVVAPAWDGVADDVPDQIADVRAMLLDGIPLGRAVKRASDRAADRLPAWRARALGIVGDWR